MILIKAAIQNLIYHWAKSLAIVLTIASGIGALYIFHGFNTGIMNQYRDNTIHSRYGNAQINTIGYQDNVYEKPWVHWIGNYPELELAFRKIPGIQEIYPRLDFYALISNGNITVSGKGQGVIGERESVFFNMMNFESGKNLDAKADGVIVGKGLAKSLDLKVGSRVSIIANTIYGSINGSDLEVVGIFHTGVKEFDDSFFRLQLVEAQKLLDTDKVEKISLSFHDINDWDRVNQYFSKEHKNLEITPFEVLDKVYYQNAVDWLNNQFKVIQIIILTIIILGIFNTISSGILERRKETSSLRANGETSLDIIKLFSIEALILGIIGDIIGIGFSHLLTSTVLARGIQMPPSPGFSRSFYVLIELQVSYIIPCVLLGMGCALVSSLLASYKVAYMPISKGLQS